MGWLEDLGTILPVEQVYKDVAQPAAQEIGEVLQSTIKAARFAVAPIEYLAAQHQRWKRFLERLSKKVPEDNLIEAHPQIAGPVFDGLRYVEESSIIAELFLNLLARAIDKQRVSEAHPAFAQIIGQLSPDEAIVIFRLEKRSLLFRQYAKYYAESRTFASRELVENEFPVSQLVLPENCYPLHGSPIQSESCRHLAGWKSRANNGRRITKADRS